MLVLSRKQDQTIHIGNSIVIRICQLKGSKVRIGVEAPDDVRVLRGELDIWAGQPPALNTPSVTPSAPVVNQYPPYERK